MVGEGISTSKMLPLLAPTKPPRNDFFFFKLGEKFWDITVAEIFTAGKGPPELPGSSRHLHIPLVPSPHLIFEI